VHHILTVRSLACVNPCDVDSCNLARGNHALLAVIHAILHMCVLLPLLEALRLTCPGGQCAATPCSQGGTRGEGGGGGHMLYD